MDLLWTIVGVLALLWLVGVIFGGFGSLIHLLLVIILIIVVYRLWKGKNIVTGK